MDYENGGAASMRPSDWLLAYLSLPLGDNEQVELDPIRIQKGLFLFAMEGRTPPEELYEFVPYNYGACSFQIYGDLDRLVKEGLVDRRQDITDPWPRYRLTVEGKARAEELVRTADQRKLRQLKELKEWLSQRGFLALLKEIYRKYPYYAQRSLLRL